MTNNNHLKKDITLAIKSREQGEDEKNSGGFWDLSRAVIKSENPQELIYSYLVAFAELESKKEITEVKELADYIGYYLSETCEGLSDWDCEHLAINMLNELKITKKGGWK